jgi:hypothetical protein
MANENNFSADEIEQIVNARKKEAEQLGLPHFAHEIYKRVQYWPKTFSEPARGWTKPAPYITSAEEHVRGKSTTIKICTADNGLVVLRKDEVRRSDDGDFSRFSSRLSTTYDLSIIVAEKIVFTTSLVETAEFFPDTVITNSSTSGISAYVPGSWVNELKSLYSRMEAAQRDLANAKAKEHKNDPNRLNDLKGKFGI